MKTQKDWLGKLLTNFIMRDENLNQRIISLGRMLKWNQSIIPKEDCEFWKLQGCKVEEINKMSATYYTATLPKFKIEKQIDVK